MEPYSIQHSAHRDAVLAVQQAALAAVEPGAAVLRHVRRSGDCLLVERPRPDLAGFIRHTLGFGL